MVCELRRLVECPSTASTAPGHVVEGETFFSTGRLKSESRYSLLELNGRCCRRVKLASVRAHGARVSDNVLTEDIRLSQTSPLSTLL